MQLCMIGLGRMGGNIVRRLMRDGHDCVVFDRDPKAVAELTGPQGSHQLSSMLSADALAFIPSGEGEADVGQLVDIELL